MIGSTAAARLAATSVLVVGDAMLDRYWFGDVERISPEAPVPIVRVTGEEFRLGGAANVARNAAALGARVSLASVIGEDEPAGRMRELLAAHRIDALPCVDPAYRTIVKLRVTGRAQQLLRIDFEEPPRAEPLEALLALVGQAASRHDAVVLSDYGKGGLTHVQAMIAAARAAGRPVLVDPKGDDYRPYAGATLLTPNRAELARVTGQWTGEADLEARAQRLRAELGLDALLVTRSEEGMSLFDAEGHVRVVAQAREVFDVTGAGDTVIGVLAVLVAAGWSIREAMPIANRAGSIVVGRFGSATVQPEELFG